MPVSDNSDNIVEEQSVEEESSSENCEGDVEHSKKRERGHEDEQPGENIQARLLSLLQKMSAKELQSLAKDAHSKFFNLKLKVERY